jgi:hypothetical protein
VKIGYRTDKCWRAGTCAKFGIARKNVSVRVCALNLALRSVHMHKKCARCGHS